MNIENAKKLVSQLERLPDEKFWMADYIIHPEDFAHISVIAPKRGNCGTVACIAGWASLSNGGPNSEVNSFKWARDWLGLDMDDARYLFRGYWTAKPLEEVTRSEAISELNRMIAEAERTAA